MTVRNAVLWWFMLGVFSTVVASAQTRGPSGVEEVAPISSPGSRVALVMGNAAYPGPDRLKNPVNDATDMAAVLKGCGFKVELVTDANLSEMRGALDRFFASVPRDGVALVYYAGHGVEVEKENYLIPVSDPPLKYESQVPDMALALDEVLDRLGHARTALNIVILDACRNNPLIKELPDGTRSQGGGGLEVVRAAEGTLVAYATQPGNVSSDGPGARNGVYTAELLRLLQEPGWDLLGLFNQVGVAVSKKTKKVQSPWMSNSPIEGQFYFRPGEDPLPVPTPVQTPESADSKIREQALAKLKSSLVTKVDSARRYNDYGDSTFKFSYKILDTGVLEVKYVETTVYEREGSSIHTYQKRTLTESFSLAIGDIDKTEVTTEEIDGLMWISISMKDNISIDVDGSDHSIKEVTRIRSDGDIYLPPEEESNHYTSPQRSVNIGISKNKENVEAALSALNQAMITYSN